MKEKLIELLKEAETKVAEELSTPLSLEEWIGIYADHLLANGVIVLPFKVWQEVWDICEFLNEESHPEMYRMKADEITVCGDGWFVYDDVNIRHEDIGRIFFTSREEAEAALKEAQR